MTRLDEILHEVNCAAFRAIDETLTAELGIERKVWIMDKHLPALIPAIEAATKAAMREVYDLMPESLNIHPKDAERTRLDMVQSLKNLDALKAQGLVG